MVKEIWVDSKSIGVFKGIHFLDINGSKMIIEGNYWSNKNGIGFIVEVNSNKIYDTINFGKIIGSEVLKFFGDKNGLR